MIALALLAAATDPNRAADWACATPLIEKNYTQTVPTRQLALRISDECAKPYETPSDPIYQKSPTLVQSDRNVYALEVNAFTNQIQGELLKLQRRKAIKLVR